MSKIKFALNHMVAPQLDLPAFLALTRQLGLDAVELRNDLSDDQDLSGENAKRIAGLLQEYNMTLLSINALQRFNVWNEEREKEAHALARFAEQCGAEALVLCPLNSASDHRDSQTIDTETIIALKALAPVLQQYHLIGLIEPLGFEISSLRHKSVVNQMLEAVEGQYYLLHDTFHHHLSGEVHYYPQQTQLVHISGVCDAQVPLPALQDSHRVLVNQDDRLGNVAQIRALVAGGYKGYLSFEPFAQSVHQQSVQDLYTALHNSMSYLRASLSA